MLIHEENKYVHKDVLNNMTRQQRYGVISGIVVEAQDTPDMSLKISAGEYLFNGNKISFTGESNLSIAAANPDLNRYDLIVLDDSGNVSVLSGIESLSDDDPTLTGPLPINDYDPDTYLPIARVFVGAGVSEIIDLNIKDISILVFEHEKYNVPVGSIISWLKTYGLADSGTTTAENANELIETGQDFLTSVKVGYLVHNTSDDTFTYVIEIVDDDTLFLEDDIMGDGDTYNIYKIPKLSENFVECNGQTLDDSESIFDGEVIPNLNGNNNFLRGNSTSGGTNTLGATGSADIPYYDVVYIMRIK